ncbi:hypothetical protein STEG23_021037, partial [Scotinomys teguina]
AQRWRSENFERPVDLEGSGDDDSFPDDELDDLYSGSGSGYFEQESGLETAMRFVPDMALAVPTAPAVLPTTEIQPVDTPIEELLSEQPSPEPVTSPPLVTEVSEVLEEPSQRVTTISITTSTTTATTTGAPTMATAPATAATTAASTPEVPPATATIADVRTTSIQGLLPLPLTTAATAQATTPAAPSPPTTVATLDTEAPTPRLVNTATSRPRAFPRPVTTQEPDVAERSTLPLGTTAPGPTEVAQVRTVGEGVSVECTGVGFGWGLGGARAVIVGGVVGALFAAFLVTLLIYRMKKKDEGSYTLEEPKQASVTYQKPDKQEEFYA